MTGTTYDGALGLAVRGRQWVRTQRPPLSLTVLDRLDHLLVLPSDQSGGLRGGDRVTTEVSAAEGARVTWRPPTSSLYFPDRGRGAVCSVATRLTVAAGTSLAWMPPVSIPCRGSRVDQQVDIVGEPGAELLYWDGWADGRTASGERGTYAELTNRLEVRWGGRTVFRERWTHRGQGPLGAADPAGFHGACQWHLALASGPTSTALLRAWIRAWQQAGELAEGGELDDGLVLGRVLSRRPLASPLSVGPSDLLF